MNQQTQNDQAEKPVTDAQESAAQRLQDMIRKMAREEAEKLLKDHNLIK